MRKMKHDKNKINLSPFLFPMSLFLPFRRLEQNQFCWRSVGLALGKRDNPKVVCLNANEGVRLVWKCPFMKVGSVSGGKITLYYCTGNRWKKFLIEKIDSEISVLIMPTSWWFMYILKQKSLATHHRYTYLLQTSALIFTLTLKFFCSKCEYNLIQYQILQNFICMERSACHKMYFKWTKCRYFEHSPRSSENCSGQLWWTLTYQRQFLDVIQSEFAVRNVTRLDVIWMKRTSSGVSFLSVWPISCGLQPTLFARNDWLFGKQLFLWISKWKAHN